jgi:hypothetical protein
MVDDVGDKDEEDEDENTMKQHSQV